MVAKILKFLQKFKSQKGATGADIVVALSIIVLTIGTVSLIYVNVSKGSKNVNRTAGATRIATNILEYIDSISYDEFNSGLNISANVDKGISVSDASGKKTIIIEGAKTGDERLFSTKIPKGYTVELIAENIYSDRAEKADLIKEITVNVKFKGAGKNSSDVNKIDVVSLSTSKIRDDVSYANKPDLTTLSIATGKAYVPIKYSKVQECYVVAKEEDNDWYNYESKIWAMVYIDTTSNINTIKKTGKLSAINNNNVYYWIPRFSEDGKMLYGSSSHPIEYSNFNYTVNSNTKNLSLLTVKSTTSTPESNSFNGNIATGIWVQKSNTSHGTYTKFKQLFGVPQY